MHINKITLLYPLFWFQKMIEKKVKRTSILQITKAVRFSVTVT